MNPIYQVFAEAPDGSIYCVLGRGNYERWFYDIEEARKVAREARAFGTTDIWIVEGRPLEKISMPEAKEQPKTPDRAPSSDLHIVYEFHALKDVPDDHDLSGDPCHDGVDGTLHRQGDLSHITDVLHEMGFRVKASRVSRKTVTDDPEFIPRQGE